LKEEGEVVSAKVPAKVKRAITRAIDKGLAMSESDYIRDAVVLKLQKDGLLEA
jgi:Arc/MetJ-type ribon-helix-helix transcriptional regulator